ASFGAEQIRCRYAAIFKNQLGSVRGKPTMLLELFSNTKPGSAFFDQEHGDAFGRSPFLSRLRCHAVKVAIDTIRDKHLRTDQKIFIAVASRPCSNVFHI